MYFVRGNLPWQERYLGGGKGGTKEDKHLGPLQLTFETDG